MHERYNPSHEVTDVLDEARQADELSRVVRQKMIEGIRGKTFTLLNPNTLKSGTVTVRDDDSYMSSEGFVWTREEDATHGTVHSVESIFKSSEGQEILQSLLKAEFVSKSVKQKVLDTILK